MSVPVIECIDIVKIFNPGENEVKALAGVSFKIEKGEYVSIMGKSGSGKSTLLKQLKNYYSSSIYIQKVNLGSGRL